MNAEEAIFLLENEKKGKSRKKYITDGEYKSMIDAYDMAIDALGNYIGERDTSMPRYISFERLKERMFSIPYDDRDFEYMSNLIFDIEALPTENVVPAEEYKKQIDMVLNLQKNTIAKGAYESLMKENLSLKEKLREAEKKKSWFERWKKRKD